MPNHSTPALTDAQLAKWAEVCDAARPDEEWAVGGRVVRRNGVAWANVWKRNPDGSETGLPGNVYTTLPNAHLIALARTALPALLQEVTRLRVDSGTNRDELFDLINDLADDTPCTHDHHGYCQTHGWLTSKRECPHKRAILVLGDWLPDEAPL